MSGAPLTLGGQARARVPGSSANLGPGFDGLGLAVGIWDEYAVAVSAEPGVRVISRGISSGEVPKDESHLVARSLLRGLQRFGVDTSGVGLDLECANRIPHGRGLGSSAAAISGGVKMAADLANEAFFDRAEGDRAEGDRSGGADPNLPGILQLSAEIEGHPDNAAASILGGFVIAWMANDQARAVAGSIHEELSVLAFVPEFRSPTEAARLALPDLVPHGDAAFNAGRSALLVHAISVDLELLLPATADRLHQDQRRASYPESMKLVDSLRSSGVAAMISGAGPTVLVLGNATTRQSALAFSAPGFGTLPLVVAPGLLG